MAIRIQLDSHPGDAGASLDPTIPPNIPLQPYGTVFATRGILGATRQVGGTSP
jgi:hypothetical protein